MRAHYLALAATLFTSELMAADHTVKMLNFGEEGSMVFEPAYVKAEVGDTITFVPQNSSHYVQSYVTPDRVTPWKSKLDQEFEVIVEKEGIYLYYCPPHLMMAMIGVVQVGAPTNLDVAKEKAAKLRPKLVMKKERLDSYLNQITR
ncbi:pseudoazurin [Agrobacterium tumefaciens]|uniref:Pseudoazurin n=1 Tax=Agrobacterium tumefaciens TaxID=358 RepID=A0A0D0J218_AGRTU|nr:pseudoazurin [Agrobacterium tumefaciens]